MIDKFLRIDQTVKARKKRNQVNARRRRRYKLARLLGFDSYYSNRLSNYSKENIRAFAKLRINDKSKEGVN